MPQENPIVEVRNIGKRFYLGGQSAGYLSLRDQLQNLLSSRKISRQEFWALKDVSFDVYENDRLAIVGRNGAGKSTLLKIISRITPPTRGEIKIKGRIASLLEVGTGFHYELSGRENIFLNGSILGLTKAEIKKNFDEIVAFADVADFIDTPLRHYSSGMQLRLAFAVAAHLEPEILIIDEVLAVGDAAFQQKCIGKMKDISDSGRTLLFVSHNMAAIRSLCNRAILLNNGVVELDTEVEPVIDAYLQSDISSMVSVDLLPIKRTKSVIVKELVFSKIQFAQQPFQQGMDISFKVWLKDMAGKGNYPYLNIAFNVETLEGKSVYHVSNEFHGQLFTHTNDAQPYAVNISCNLKPGRYLLTLFLKSAAKYQDWLQTEVMIEVADGNPYDFPSTNLIHGLVFPQFSISQEATE